MTRFAQRFARLRRWQKAALTALVVLIAGVSALSVWLFWDLPSLDRVQAGTALPSSRLYDRHGRLLYEILADGMAGGRSRPIAFNEIPADCARAAISVEDTHFYSNPGVDLMGVVRAAWINVRGGEIVAGGSTITQQVARLLLFDAEGRAERTVRRKLREMMLALQLNGRYAKDEILALYLNNAYYGNLAYGIDAAARSYFGKATPELSLAECALLAGLLQSPATYDPLNNPDAARQRQTIVLDLMARDGHITPAQADAAKTEPLHFAPVRFPIDAPHFVMAAITRVEREYPGAIQRGGLEIVTTVDRDWQAAAATIARQQLERLNHPIDPARPPAQASGAALVAIDPRTGEVLAMLGSPDYFDETHDGAVNAALALRQPGSALKPFTYAAAFDPALETPMTAATMLMDIETPFVTRRLESYTPANFALVEHGPVSVREALASSYNIPAVVALERIGVGALVDLAADAGMTSLAENQNLDLAVTLGGGEVRLLDLAGAYSIFANGGTRVEPRLFRRITDGTGAVLFDAEAALPDAQSVIDPRVAYLITDMLSDNEARIPAFGAQSALGIGRPAAAKTGTTTDFRDNWVVGYTPELVVGVWVGNPDNTPMIGITGVSGAAPIWNAFMREVLDGTPETDFTRPDDLIRAEVCAPSGLRPTEICPRRRVEWFIPGTEPTAPDNWYQRITIDRTSGALADDATPIGDRADRVYLVLPQEARDWGARNGIEAPPEAIGRRVAVDADAGLRLLEPDPYTVFQLSPLIPREAQRLRLTVGAPPNAARVTYWMDGEAIGTADAAPWALWWPLELGAHELIARAELVDGGEQVSAAIPFRVTEYAPPTSYNAGE